MQKESQQLNTSNNKNGGTTNKGSNNNEAPNDSPAPKTPFENWQKRAETGTGSLAVYWLDQEKCYVFVKVQEDGGYAYSYTYPDNGQEVADPIALYLSKPFPKFEPKGLPTTPNPSYKGQELSQLDDIKNQIKQQKAKEQEQLEKAKNAPLTNITPTEQPLNQNKQEQQPNYLWTTHSPSGATGATGGNESYPNPEETSIWQYLKDFGNGILEFDAKVREYYGYINPIAFHLFPDLQTAKDFTEDYKILITGTNWNGEEANRWLAGFLTFFPADKFIDGLKTVFKSVKRVSAKYGKLFLDDAKSCWDDFLNWSNQHQLSPAGFSADELSAFLEHQHLHKSGKNPKGNTFFSLDDKNVTGGKNNVGDGKTYKETEQPAKTEKRDTEKPHITVDGINYSIHPKLSKYPVLKNLHPEEPMPLDGKIIQTHILDDKIMVGNQPLQGNDHNFVITLEGELIIGRRYVTLSGNKPVVAAGCINIKNGKISQIEPLSGHYMPPNEQAVNFPKIFQDLGLPLPKMLKLWGDHNGKPIKYE